MQIHLLLKFLCQTPWVELSVQELLNKQVNKEYIKNNKVGLNLHHQINFVMIQTVLSQENMLFHNWTRDKYEMIHSKLIWFSYIVKTR